MTRFALTEHPDGLSAGPGNHVLYKLESNTALAREGITATHSLLFSLGSSPPGKLLFETEVDLDPDIQWLMRCDRIDFPPHGIAYLHTHPGPGIRCQLFGQLTVTAGGHTGTYRRLEPWFESGPEPVYAEAGADPAAFVRVLLLPAEWAGKRTITYVNSEDETKPKLQSATVFLEEIIES